MIYTVEKADFKKNLTLTHGEFAIYTLVITDGTTPQTVELKQKAATAAPTIGQRIEGTIEKGQYALEFKRAFQQAGGGGGRVEDPKRSAEIRRMAAQRSAVELLAVEVAAGLTFEDAKASALLLPRIDFFEADTKKAGESI